MDVSRFSGRFFDRAGLIPLQPLNSSLQDSNSTGRLTLHFARLRCPKNLHVARGTHVRHVFVALLLCLFVVAENAVALDLPKLSGYVNDHAGMLSPKTELILERELRAFEQSDSTQIVIVTVPSLEGEVLEEFSIKVAETWKIGQKGKDNGAIILVVKEERKVRIEVGRGLEGKLTDLMSGRIIDLVIKPRFKRGDFDGGLTSGVHAVIDATRGEFKAEPRPASRPSGRSGTFSQLVTFLIFGTIALLMLGGFSRVLSGAAGAIGLPAIVYTLLSPIGPVTAIVLGVIGLLAGVALPSLFSSGGRGGGLWPGGGYYGGGFGGGFGGGGGDFGGGGASGDW